MCLPPDSNLWTHVQQFLTWSSHQTGAKANRMYYLICERQLWHARTHTHAHTHTQLTVDNDNSEWFMGLFLINLFLFLFFCHILSSLSLLLYLSIFLPACHGCKQMLSDVWALRRKDRWPISRTEAGILLLGYNRPHYFVLFFLFSCLLAECFYLRCALPHLINLKTWSCLGRLKAEKTWLFCWIK